MDWTDIPTTIKELTQKTFHFPVTTRPGRSTTIPFTFTQVDANLLDFRNSCVSGTFDFSTHISTLESLAYDVKDLSTCEGYMPGFGELILTLVDELAIHLGMEQSILQDASYFRVDKKLFPSRSHAMHVNMMNTRGIDYYMRYGYIIQEFDDINRNVRFTNTCLIEFNSFMTSPELFNLLDNAITSKILDWAKITPKIGKRFHNRIMDYKKYFFMDTHKAIHKPDNWSTFARGLQSMEYFAYPPDTAAAIEKKTPKKFRKLVRQWFLRLKSVGCSRANKVLDLMDTASTLRELCGQLLSNYPNELVQDPDTVNSTYPLLWELAALPLKIVCPEMTDMRVKYYVDKDNNPIDVRVSPTGVDIVEPELEEEEELV